MPLPLHLGPYGAPGCFMNSSWDVPLVYNGTTAPFSLTIPTEPALAGIVTWWQGPSSRIREAVRW